jgi:predicted dehydrogenase
MPSPVKVALIGLDTSHAVAFAHLMHDPKEAQDRQVRSMQVSGCLRFETPYQNKLGLDERQADLAGIGVRVTEKFEEAVEGCDAILMTINDPDFHLRYFERVAALGKPVYIDKPLAATVTDAVAIQELAKKHKVPAASHSNVRYSRTFVAACLEVPQPELGTFCGRMAPPPAGNPYYWYPVHSFELMHAAMGAGAKRVDAHKTEQGFVAIVEFDNGRQATVAVSKSCAAFNGILQRGSSVRPFVVDPRFSYTDHLLEMERFFRGCSAIRTVDPAVEVVRIIDATQRSIESGKPVELGAST